MSEAHSQIDRPQTRRNALKAIAGGGVTFLVPTSAIAAASAAALAASPDDDKRLWDLWNRYCELELHLDQANDAYEAARAKAAADYPPEPRINRVYQPQMRSGEGQRLREQWRAAVAVINERHQIDQLIKRTDELADEQCAVMKDILDAPIGGLFGIGLKLRLFTELEPLRGGGQDELHVQLMHRLLSEVATLLV